MLSSLCIFAQAPLTRTNLTVFFRKVLSPSSHESANSGAVLDVCGVSLGHRSRKADSGVEARNVTIDEIQEVNGRRLFSVGMRVDTIMKIASQHPSRWTHSIPCWFRLVCWLSRPVTALQLCRLRSECIN